MGEYICVRCGQRTMTQSVCDDCYNLWLNTWGKVYRNCDPGELRQAIWDKWRNKELE
jgi:hypothetical protein